jgi:hypothetical protein
VLAVDPAAELEADNKNPEPFPRRYAVARPVTITPTLQGTWEPVTNGRVWRVRIDCAGATDINLGFSRFWLPEGATLYVRAESENYFQGPFTAQDNKPHGQLWTPVVPGGAAMVELFVPTEATQEPQIVLTQVGGGYRDMFHRKDGGTPKAGSCNIDVVCPQAASWSNEIRSVAWYSISGVALCSGTLIADAAQDFRNFFLTANHCGLNGGNAPSVTVYWNFQSPSCGQHGGGSLAQNQSGAVFRASKYDCDFSLIELDEMPDATFNVFYSGWNRSGTAPGGCVGIHHPNTDEKSISFSANALTTVNSCIGTGGVNTHWRVVWTSGVTEPGSSGSGIWDPSNHQLIGTLSGGGSACSSPTAADCYGKFSVGWASGTSSSDRLRDWLDPQNTAAMSVTGVDPNNSSIIRLASASLATEGFAPPDGAVEPGEQVTMNISLQNLGGLPTTNLTATLLATGGISNPGPAQNYGVVARGNPPVTQTFSFTATGICGGTINPVLQLQDGSVNLGTVTFAVPLGVGTQTQLLAQTFDGVSAPSLPAGWTSSITGSGTAFATTTAQSDTPPNSAFAANPAVVTDNRLVSPLVTGVPANTRLIFRHRYITESGYDGGALEISINGGAFTDILTAGGSFASNAYNATLSSSYMNPLAGRSAWSGNSGSFVTTVVNLPASAVGGNVQFRWRFGSDTSISSTGWYVDTVSLVGTSYSCLSALVQPLIVNPRLTGPGSMAFSYQSANGHTYFVESTPNLITPVWTTLQTNAGDGSLKSFTNSTSGLTARYFRVRTQ